MDFAALPIGFLEPARLISTVYSFTDSKFMYPSSALFSLQTFSFKIYVVNQKPVNCLSQHPLPYRVLFQAFLTHFLSFLLQKKNLHEWFYAGNRPRHATKHKTLLYS